MDYAMTMPGELKPYRNTVRDAFVVICGECGEVRGAFDPLRSSDEMIGQAVSVAAQDGSSIGFLPSPVTIGNCDCHIKE